MGGLDNPLETMLNHASLRNNFNERVLVKCVVLAKMRSLGFSKSPKNCKNQSSVITAPPSVFLSSPYFFWRN